MTGSSPLPSPAASGPTIKPDAEAERPLPPPCQTPSTAGLAAAAACAAEAEDDLDNSSSSPSYLVVLSHGLVGTSDDVAYLKESLERSRAPGILVHSAQCNTGKTKDGVANGGERLAKEILQLVSSRPSLRRISLVGHSLGGLYLRYAAKLLYNDGGDARAAPGGRPTVAGLRPSVFMTIASPHLGVRRFTYVPLPSMLHPLGEVVVGGKTGADLFLSKRSVTVSSPNNVAGGDDVADLPSPSPSPPSDDAGFSRAGQDQVMRTCETAGGGGSGEGSPGREGGGRTAESGGELPLLYVMATSEEFLRPLKAFRWRRVYANRRGDTLVPYGTAAFPSPDEGRDGPEGNGGGSQPGGAGGEGGLSAPTSADASVEAVAPAGSVTPAAIVGVSWVPPREEESAENQRTPGGKGESVEISHRKGISARVRGSLSWAAASARRRLDERKRIEREMAAGLNSCGWEKVSVNLGYAPVSHNKIMAMSHTRTSRVLYGGGRAVVDHAADFLVTRDGKGIDRGRCDNAWP